VFAVLGLVLMGASPLAYSRVIFGWFDALRGRALGVTLAVAAASAVVFPPIAQALIRVAGWRLAWAMLGSATLLIAVPVAARYIGDSVGDRRRGGADRVRPRLRRHQLVHHGSRRARVPDRGGRCPDADRSACSARRPGETRPAGNLKVARAHTMTQLPRDAQLINPQPRTTPAWFLKRASGVLPADLLNEASGRLGITSLLLAGLALGAGVLRRIVAGMRTPSGVELARYGVVDGIVAAMVIASVALYFYTRRTRRNPRFILDIGQVYLVFTALVIAVMINWEPVPPNASVLPMISPIGPIMLMFAALLPNTPMKVGLAGLVAVSMNPFSMLLAHARGTWEFGPLSNAFLMHSPDYLLVGIAVAISQVMTRLGEHVAKAREMGSYQLGDLLGRGGMGEVYKANHRMLARPAAIKLIRPDLISAADSEDTQMALKRFRREAEVAASLRSPHTVELYDFGVTDDRTFYLAMELLDGVDLESLIREKGPLPAGRVVYLLQQVCESLEEAHASGLVHRDIKPANIHVGRLGVRHDFVKVLDFGLVKSAVEPAATQTRATAVGLALGTPAYMAPEMSLGESIDGRADIYSLGCVAYYLLSGQLVFEGAGLQILVKRLHEEPPPLSGRTEIPVPPDLEAMDRSGCGAVVDNQHAGSKIRNSKLGCIVIPSRNSRSGGCPVQRARLHL
jgi:serine/threonine-protein kinase